MAQSIAIGKKQCCVIVKGGRKPVGHTQLEPGFSHMKQLGVLRLSLGWDAGSFNEGSNTTTICHWNPFYCNCISCMACETIQGGLCRPFVGHFCDYLLPCSCSKMDISLQILMCLIVVTFIQQIAVSKV